MTRWLTPLLTPVLLLAAPVCAQETTATSTEAQVVVQVGEPSVAVNASALSPEVQALLADAVSEYDAARYREAQALFQRAHELAPSARALRGVGMASFEVGQYVVALRALRLALAEQARPLSDAQRRHVEALIARTEVFVATLVVDAEAHDTPFLIDGEPARREADGSVMLDPGEHVVAVVDTRGQSQTLRIALVGGTRRTLTVRPSAVARAPDELTAAGVSLLVLGALTGVASIATGVLALDHQGQVARACDGFTCPGSVLPIRDRARDLALATDVLGVSAAVSAALGAILVMVQVFDSPPPVRLGASLEHVSLSVVGEF